MYFPFSWCGTTGFVPAKLFLYVARDSFISFNRPLSSYLKEPSYALTGHEKIITAITVNTERLVIQLNLLAGSNLIYYTRYISLTSRGCSGGVGVIVKDYRIRGAKGSRVQVKDNNAREDSTKEQESRAEELMCGKERCRLSVVYTEQSGIDEHHERCDGPPAGAWHSLYSPFLNRSRASRTVS